MRSLYVASTGQHVGKTTVALGLMAALNDRGVRCQYFKPVGQHFFDFYGHRADEDAWLCREVLGSGVEAERMSPIIVSSGYVSQYLQHPEPERLRMRILEAERFLRKDGQMLLAEGTGHAGVGSCLDLSNAAVARMLDAVVLLVVPGGVGRTLDEAALNLNLFASSGVPVAGVIANKVLPDKIEKVSASLALGFERLGTRLLGVIPYEPVMTCPTMEQIRQELDARVLCGHEGMAAVVENTVIAAMTPQNVLGYLRPGSLVVTPGDRIDNILLAISAHRAETPQVSRKIAGIVLTGGLVPHMAVMPLIKSTRLPVLLCDQDTFAVSSRIAQWVFKINPRDAGKIAAAQCFVRKYVDVEHILTRVDETGPAVLQVGAGERL